MDYRYIEVDGKRLAYTEKNSTAENAIIFIHGNSGSSRWWQQQLSDERFSGYRLLAVDLPGMGASFWSGDPAEDYSPAGTGKLMAEAIRSLVHSHPFVLVGMSYGTNVIAEMLQYHIKPSGIVLIGCCCLGEMYGMDQVFKTPEITSIFTYNETSGENVIHFLNSIIGNMEAVKLVAEEYKKTDPNLKPYLFQTAAAGRMTDEIKALRNWKKPLCLIAGEDDQLVHPDYLQDSALPVWSGAIISLPKAGHFVHMEKAEKVSEVILNYASEMMPHSA